MMNQVATIDPEQAELVDSPDSSTDEHDDCSEYHDRVTERKWASADALHRGALATQALSSACQVMRLGTLVGVGPVQVADRAKAVADELLDWLLENNPVPSQVRDQVDVALPPLENPHPDTSQFVAMANLLGGASPSAASSRPADEPDDPADIPGSGVYL